MRRACCVCACSSLCACVCLIVGEGGRKHLQSFLREVRQMPSSVATAFSGRWKYLDSTSSFTFLLCEERPARSSSAAERRSAEAASQGPFDSACLVRVMTATDANRSSADASAVRESLPVRADLLASGSSLGARRLRDAAGCSDSLAHCPTGMISSGGRSRHNPACRSASMQGRVCKTSSRLLFMGCASCLFMGCSAGWPRPWRPGAADSLLLFHPLEGG
jgi:hypothetical protein